MKREQWNLQAAPRSLNISLICQMRLGIESVFSILKNNLVERSLFGKCACGNAGWIMCDTGNLAVLRTLISYKLIQFDMSTQKRIRI